MTKHEALSRSIEAFARTRDWAQFRSPKNTALALGAATGQVVEHFLWITQDESRDLPAARRAVVREELADAFIYLARLADQLDIDLYAAAAGKLADSERRYPAAKARGRGGKRAVAKG